ncbi:hypothetical protein BP6252_02517 [Coleophoma cylindrospora]|uniref:Large ribosomal subunit protein mL49 n=1 Tax=Coleophoma cylindrospora TaxID=1849047 RepID=A0A3D8SF05_9HELO|nr:hypothetical protein BP6252_02517 [Coleophoma cylindrospora]
MRLPRPSTIQRFLNTAATTAATATAPILPYRIARTPSKNLPIYLLNKAGGNKKMTKLRKIEGDISALRSEIQATLGLDEKDVVINQLTRHILIKGHKKPELIKFFEERNI